MVRSEGVRKGGRKKRGSEGEGVRRLDEEGQSKRGGR